MPIRTIVIDNKGNIAREVEINADNAIQCCRANEEGYEANLLYFFDPATELGENELAGVIIDRSIMKSDPVVMRFNASAPILPIVQDLMIIYGNLYKAGL